MTILLTNSFCAEFGSFEKKKIPTMSLQERQKITSGHFCEKLLISLSQNYGAELTKLLH